MLSKEENEALTEVRAGTPMGELLRRYWMPIAAESELESRRVLPVRVLEEDLVLYREPSGGYGLIERWCPHRRFDLAFAAPEERGLRCSHHGWCFDNSGQCVEQPFEDRVRPSSHFKERVRAKAYPVQSKAGLLYAYLGPAPAPLIPDWAGFYSPGYTVVAMLHLPCNWVQVMEGFYDPVHVEWLHDRWSYLLNDKEVPERRPTHTDFRWLEFEHGVVFQRKLEGSDEWLADRTVVFPNLDGAGGQGWYLTWVVPVDQRNTLMVYRHTITSWRSPLGQVMVPPGRPQQARVPSYRVRAQINPDLGPSADFGSHLISQDYASWLSPGAIVDRSKEHLGETDRGVIHFRKMLLEQSRRVESGQDPLGVLRSEEQNKKITLPGARKGYGIRGEGLPGMSGAEDVMFRAFLPFDPPAEIKAEVEENMQALVAGLRPDWWKKRRS